MAAYKPQLAFYEAMGIGGLQVLEQTVDYIRGISSRTLIIGDAKRGDTDNTAEAYAKAMFDYWGFDATTVQLYQGTDSLMPFLQYRGKLVFVCCRTSNPSSEDLQDLVDRTTGATVYETVARLSVEAAADEDGEIGLVVGATYPGEMQILREQHAEVPFLIPGVGAQRGEAERAARIAGRNSLINSSRAIIYASDSASDFDEAARDAVEELRRKIAGKKRLTRDCRQIGAKIAR